MFIIKKNQILIVTLVIMITIAGYLNYNDKKAEQEYLLNENFSVDLVPSSIMNDEQVEENNEVDKDDENLGIATLIENIEDEEYENFFVEAKLNRDETREERKEWLMELINTVAISDEKKEDAYSEILSIQEKLEKENQMESLIESKGFGKSYVRIDDDGMIDVIVNKQNLTQNEISQISDIVRRVAGITIGNLKISSYKNEN